jgi:hypothetical protein
LIARHAGMEMHVPCLILTGPRGFCYPWVKDKGSHSMSIVEAKERKAGQMKR